MKKNKKSIDSIPKKNHSTKCQVPPQIPIQRVSSQEQQLPLLQSTRLSKPAEVDEGKFVLQCHFIEGSDGSMSEPLYFKLDFYLKTISMKLTAVALIDFMFSKALAFDEQAVQVCKHNSDNDYVDLMTFPEPQNQSILEIGQTLIKVQLIRKRSIYQRLFAAENATKNLLTIIQQKREDQWHLQSLNRPLPFRYSFQSEGSFDSFSQDYSNQSNSFDNSRSSRRNSRSSNRKGNSDSSLSNSPPRSGNEQIKSQTVIAETPKLISHSLTLPPKQTSENTVIQETIINHREDQHPFFVSEGITSKSHIENEKKSEPLGGNRDRRSLLQQPPGAVRRSVPNIRRLSRLINPDNLKDTTEKNTLSIEVIDNHSL